MANSLNRHSCFKIRLSSLIAETQLPLFIRSLTLVWILGIAIALSPAALRAQDEYGCADRPLALIQGTPGRPQVDGDYLVIVYDAKSRQTYWYDYNSRTPALGNIVRNGSFLPVVYTKEKIAVRVCNLHFGDVLTVTNNPQGLPEGGADIRGNSTLTTTAPSVSTTLDVLQTATGTGTATQIGGLGFSAPASITSLAITGISAGTLTLGPTASPVAPNPSNTNPVVSNFTYASTSISPDQLALTMFALQESARDLHDSIKEVWDGTHGGQVALPGSVKYLREQSGEIRDRITHEISTSDSAWLSDAALSDAALFDQELTTTQNLVTQLSALSNALNSQSFGARATLLQSNYTTVEGIVDLIKEGKTNGITPPTCADPKAGCKNQDLVARSQVESAMFDKFYQEYKTKLGQLCDQQRASEIRNRARTPLTCGDPSDDSSTFTAVFDDLHQLQEDLSGIDRNTGELFRAINSWNDNSHVEQTDLIIPITGNAFERLSIVVQHGYTPFVLSGPPASISAPPAAASAPAFAAPAASATPPGASTSTPAHAVKTILIEVHRRANFNLAGGVVMIHVPTSIFTAQLSPVAPVAIQNAPAGATELQQGTCNGKTSPIPLSTTATTFSNYYCAAATQNTEWQVAAMAAMVWYPWGRDYFPRKSGYSVKGHDLIPGLLMGTSVTSLGNALGAVNFEPITGIDLFAGVASAHTVYLTDGLAPNSPVGLTAIPSTLPTLPQTTTVHAGFSAGIALDITVFTQLFTKSGATGAVMP